MSLKDMQAKLKALLHTHTEISTTPNLTDAQQVQLRELDDQITNITNFIEAELDRENAAESKRKALQDAMLSAGVEKLKEQRSGKKSTGGHKGWSHYQKMRKEDAKRYYLPKTQHEIAQAHAELGEKFFQI